MNWCLFCMFYLRFRHFIWPKYDTAFDKILHPEYCSVVSVPVKMSLCFVKCNVKISLMLTIVFSLVWLCHVTVSLMYTLVFSRWSQPSTRWCPAFWYDEHGFHRDRPTSWFECSMPMATWTCDCHGRWAFDVISKTIKRLVAIRTGISPNIHVHFNCTLHNLSLLYTQEVV